MFQRISQVQNRAALLKPVYLIYWLKTQQRDSTADNISEKQSVLKVTVG